uniref:Uncharacterized protein n=1 Tax=Anguilla anguilla TaxID=7936 RepID=A0A0E9S6V2_ANGAN
MPLFLYNCETCMCFHCIVVWSLLGFSLHAGYWLHDTQYSTLKQFSTNHSKDLRLVTDFCLCVRESGGS